MDGVLTIEGEALEMAEELARVSGQPIQSIVTDMLRERLERERNAHAAREAEIEERMRRVRVITADIRHLLGHPLPSSDHSWMYDDETGLPK